MKTLDGFSSRRNCYLIFAKNDIAKEPSADTLLFLSLFPFSFSFSFSFLFLSFFLSPLAYSPAPQAEEYPVPPKGRGERPNLYLPVKRKNL